LKSFLKEVEGFALGDYSAALSKGDQLAAAERKATIDKLIRYTGLDARYLDETNLRWDVSLRARGNLRWHLLKNGLAPPPLFCAML
jgi:hypothetical protein